ncbi:MAG: phosphatase PAP2 family protein [Alphaproteobacteria bacterium]|nr:phosphatase PAP2 family protein [Alphaproteobacteria bacterium]
MKRILMTVAVLAASCLPLQAAFLAPSDYRAEELLPAPPADGSPAAKAEMDELHRIEATRTPDQFAKALADDRDEDITAFYGVMGRGFDLKQLPKTARLFADVKAEEKAAAKLAKNTFRRKRPWIVDPALKTCASDDAPLSSYPSGHSTMGYAMATVLAALAPEKAPAIMARARQFAENRLVCSMHFRSDIAAGQVLGTVVAVELMHKPAFMTEFEAARAELITAHVVAP